MQREGASEQSLIKNGEDKELHSDGHGRVVILTLGVCGLSYQGRGKKD